PCYPTNLTPTPMHGQTPSAGHAPKPPRHATTSTAPTTRPTPNASSPATTACPALPWGTGSVTTAQPTPTLSPHSSPSPVTPAAAPPLVFPLAGDTGPRPLGRFLELTQLDRFVAPSFGAQQALAVRFQDTLIPYADEQKQQLAAGMPPKKITACLDENFHGSQP